MIIKRNQNWYIFLISMLLIPQICPVTAISDLTEDDSPKIAWKYWNSKDRLNNDSNWIEHPELKQAPPLNSAGIPILLDEAENSSFTFGVLADRQVYVYLEVEIGDLNLYILSSTGELLYNSSNYAGYNEFITFTPNENENIVIKIIHPIEDSTEIAQGLLYIRQNMVFSGTKMQFFMNATSENYSTLYFRVDQDFGGICLDYPNSLVLQNLTIFHSIRYLERDDFYSFLVYEDTYELTNPTDLINVNNQKYTGLQTLEWACQKSAFSEPILDFAINNSHNFANVSGLLPYKPELGLVELGTGFPAGTYLTLSVIQGFGTVNITIYPVKGEEILQEDPINDDSTETTGTTNNPSNPVISGIPERAYIIGGISIVGIIFFSWSAFKKRRSFFT